MPDRIQVDAVAMTCMKEKASVLEMPFASGAIVTRMGRDRAAGSVKRQRDRARPVRRAGPPEEEERRNENLKANKP